MKNRAFWTVVLVLVLLGIVLTASAYPVNTEKKVVKSHYKSWGYNPNYSMRCNRIAYQLIGGKTPSTTPASVKTHKMMSIGCFRPTL